MSNTKIRIGNDIDIRWTLVDGDGNPYPLAGRDISVEIVIGMRRVRIEEVEVVGINTLHFCYRGKDQKHTGPCDLKFVENDGRHEMVTFDSPRAFTLVSHSWQAVDADEEPERVCLEYTTVTSQLTERIGPVGPAAGFGEVSATIDAETGIPAVEVTSDGPDNAKNFHFAFHNLKGEKGDKGDKVTMSYDPETKTLTIEDSNVRVENNTLII